MHPLLRAKAFPIFTVLLMLVCFDEATAGEAEISIIKPGQSVELDGKEVDWIYGDYLLRNNTLSVVIAAPLPTRDANMTIRAIGGSILDLTLNQPSNDQLSAFTPTAGRYLFQNPDLVEWGKEGDRVYWQCQSSRTIAKDETVATVRYELQDDSPYLEATVTISGDRSPGIQAWDGVRADGWFEFENDKARRIATCTDSFFRQSIGFQVPASTQPPQWKQGRPYQLRYSDSHLEKTTDSIRWKVRLYPATSLQDLHTIIESAENSVPQQTIRVTRDLSSGNAVDTLNRAKVRVARADNTESTADDTDTPPLQTDDSGLAHLRLPPGVYLVTASAIGCDPVQVPVTVNDSPSEFVIPLETGSGLIAEVRDDTGKLIPAKATIYSIDGEDPNFGLSSARTFVENLVYSVHGRFHCPLDPGRYEIYFSRGPEYDAIRREILITEGKVETIAVQLDRVVQSNGWISADFHSHSSPSGDNTSDQYGRVENLLCEQIEFAPCTEHNVVSSYMPHLESMGLTHLMATCTGMELTGTPTPVNHQNAFPLHHHPHTQNGGGPRSSYNPAVQIERLAMWDRGSEKVVQMNHPNLHQIYGDADSDGVADEGFRSMLKWTDIVEVHPLAVIFRDVVNDPPTGRRKSITIHQWMQLINQGYRIPGVINTDSHYNHHGSGWRRNWVACSTDDPSEITTDEMVKQTEAGHIVMSNGPFLSVQASADAASGDGLKKEKPGTETPRTIHTHSEAIPGDNLHAPSGVIRLSVNIQCPNWLDVNRVQVFINGRPDKALTFTARENQGYFGTADNPIKFAAELTVTLDQDSHIIVAAIGEGLTMEKVMGSRFGKIPPTAVSNPIYVDIDGGGFQPNGDLLGLPLLGTVTPQLSDPKQKSDSNE
ncbi:CehA/McbA family metallohydrolase [Rubripirellula sp.]|nr:CehA/McbA family metallohydrolase [Rubripirellula sp.]